MPAACECTRTFHWHNLHCNARGRQQAPSNLPRSCHCPGPTSARRSSSAQPQSGSCEPAPSTSAGRASTRRPGTASTANILAHLLCQSRPTRPALSWLERSSQGADLPASQAAASGPATLANAPSNICSMSAAWSPQTAALERCDEPPNATGRTRSRATPSTRQPTDAQHQWCHKSSTTQHGANDWASLSLDRQRLPSGREPTWLQTLHFKSIPVSIDGSGSGSGPWVVPRGSG